MSTPNDEWEPGTGIFWPEVDEYDRKRLLSGMDDVDPAAHLVSPVRCLHCNTIYDLVGAAVGDAHVARYADCDVFKAPCCGRTVDTRMWKALPDMERVERWEI